MSPQLPELLASRTVRPSPAKFSSTHTAITLAGSSEVPERKASISTTLFSRSKVSCRVPELSAGTWAASLTLCPPGTSLSVQRITIVSIKCWRGTLPQLPAILATHLRWLRHLARVKVRRNRYSVDMHSTSPKGRSAGHQGTDMQGHS